MTSACKAWASHLRAFVIKQLLSEGREKVNRLNRKKKTGNEKIHPGPLRCAPTSSGQLNASAPVNTLWASPVQARLSRSPACKFF